jgi:hypothetical protein
VIDRASKDFAFAFEGEEERRNASEGRDLNAANTDHESLTRVRIVVVV